MHIGYAARLLHRWSAQDPIKREFRCSRCGRRWQPNAASPQTSSDCETCRPKAPSSDPVPARREWIA
jgi:DNA-directed RNA polymerase subunit RPC12/RpoP